MTATGPPASTPKQVRDWTDWINPILVKEMRQAAKSRAFTWTFVLVLVCVWSWTLIGININWQDAFIESFGQTMLMGYAGLTSVPLLLVIPFFAFRAMVVEQEANTFELLSIATIPPEQIVRGKLITALWQSVVYFSLIAPCLAFTYLLGGVELRQIGAIMLFLAAASLAAVSAAIFLGTIAMGSVVAVGLTMLLTGSLVMAAWLSLLYIGAIIWDPFNFVVQAYGRYPEAMLTFYGVGFAGVLAVLAAAAARITPPAMNRSARVRTRLLLLAATFVPLASFPAFRGDTDSNYPYGMSFVFSAVWLFVATLLIAEREEISPRVRRSLPRSTLARIVWGWTVPGSGTGYLFAVVAAFAVALAVISIHWSMAFKYRTAILMQAVYFTMYVSAARLYLRRLRKRYPNAGFVVALGIMAALLCLGNVAVLILPLAGMRNLEGSLPLALVTCWPWAIASIREFGAEDVVWGALAVTAPLVLLNLRSAAQQLFISATAEPEMVAAARKKDDATPYVDPLSDD